METSLKDFLLRQLFPSETVLVIDRSEWVGTAFQPIIVSITARWVPGRGGATANKTLRDQ